MNPLRTIVAMLTLAAGGAAFAQTTPLVVSAPVECATSNDGSVVGVPNPLAQAIVAAGYTGTLPAGNYYVEIGWYDAATHVTLAGPEIQVQLTATGNLTINLPASGKPALAVGMDVYIGSVSGQETLQGVTTGAATFTQSAPLAAGTALPATNTTICGVIANDAGWPTGTGYTMSLTTPAGNTQPGFPAQVQLLGPGGTINLGQGLPFYNGTVNYPIPLLARPYNHAGQSISGPLSMTGYGLTQVLNIGVGTSLPAWPIDVENGFINSNLGYLINGSAGTSGQCLISGGALGPDSWGACYVPPSSTSFYQTFALNGAAQVQRPTANFSSEFTATDSSSPAQTNIGLNAPGTGNLVATYAGNPGASTAFVQFDGNGNLAPASGLSQSTSVNGYVILPGGIILEWANGATGLNGRGQTSVTWPRTFPHACLSAQATVQFDNAVTSTNYQGAAFYLQPTCTTSTVNLQYDVRPDGLADTTYHAVVFGVGW